MATGLSRAIAVGVKSKVSLAVLAGLLATGGAAGVTAAAAANGAFGQQVKEQVQDCKAQLASGTHGIGDCVSDFAQQHGAQQRQQHSQGKPSSTPGAHGNAGTAGNAGNSDAHGKPSDPGKPPTPTPNGHSKP